MSPRVVKRENKRLTRKKRGEREKEMSQSSGESFSTYIPMDQVDPSIFFVIDEMKVGEISKPVTFRTEDGRDAVRIIYLKSRSTPHQANLTDDYSKIATAALNQKRGKAVAEWFRKNLDPVYIEVDPEFNGCNALQLTQ